MLRRFKANSVKLFFFILLASTEHLTFCYEAYAVESNYENYDSLKLSEICSNHGSPVNFKLGNGNADALIIFPGEIGIPEFYGDGKNLTCKFVVKAQPGQSLSATVQSMNFKERENHCTSYVKMKSRCSPQRDKICEYFRGNLPTSFSNEFLPFLYSDQEQYVINDSRIPLGHHDKCGEITTEIFILHKDPRIKLLSSLVIVYTLNENPSRDEFSGDYMKDEYICDGIRNCYGVCNDEEKCTFRTAQKFLIPMIFVVAGIIAIWFCWRQHLLCCNERRTPQINTQLITPDDPEIYTIAFDSINFGYLPAPDDNTLPSYDTLFPERSNQTNQLTR